MSRVSPKPKDKIFDAEMSDSEESDSSEECDDEESEEESSEESDSEDDDDESDDNEQNMSQENINELGKETLQETCDSDENSDQESCPICLARFRDQNLGTPENCAHTFCLECILEWSKNINTCPIDRTEFHNVLLRNEPNGKVLNKVKVEVQPKKPEDTLQEDVTVCEVCRRGDREDRLLLCDACDLAYHCECLDSPLFHIPIDEWFCPPCARVLRTGAMAGCSTPRSRRVIPRTRASETVRNRVQSYRKTTNSRPSTSRSPSTSRISSKTPQRRKRRRTYRRSFKKVVKLARTKKNLMDGVKGKTSVQGSTVVITYRRKGRRKRRKTSKTKKAKVSSVQANYIKSAQDRIAKRLNLCKSSKGGAIPDVKQKPGSSSASYNSPTSVSLFGRKDELISFSDDNNDPQTSKPSTSSTSSSNSRSRVRAIPTTPAAPVNLLDSILASQTLLYSKPNNVVIQTNGTLALKNSSESCSNDKKSNDSPSSSSHSTSSTYVSTVKNGAIPKSQSSKTSLKPPSQKGKSNSKSFEFKRPFDISSKSASTPSKSSSEDEASSSMSQTRSVTDLNEAPNKKQIKLSASKKALWKNSFDDHEINKPFQNPSQPDSQHHPPTDSLTSLTSNTKQCASSQNTSHYIKTEEDFIRNKRLIFYKQVSISETSITSKDVCQKNNKPSNSKGIANTITASKQIINNKNVSFSNKSDPKISKSFLKQPSKQMPSDENDCSNSSQSLISSCDNDRLVNEESDSDLNNSESIINSSGYKMTGVTIKTEPLSDEEINDDSHFLLKHNEKINEIKVRPVTVSSVEKNSNPSMKSKKVLCNNDLADRLNLKGISVKIEPSSDEDDFAASQHYADRYSRSSVEELPATQPNSAYSFTDLYKNALDITPNSDQDISKTSLLISDLPLISMQSTSKETIESYCGDRPSLNLSPAQKITLSSKDSVKAIGEALPSDGDDVFTSPKSSGDKSDHFNSIKKTDSPVKRKPEDLKPSPDELVSLISNADFVKQLSPAQILSVVNNLRINLASHLSNQNVSNTKDMQDLSNITNKNPLVLESSVSLIKTEAPKLSQTQSSLLNSTPSSNSISTTVSKNRNTSTSEDENHSLLSVRNQKRFSDTMTHDEEINELSCEDQTMDDSSYDDLCSLPITQCAISQPPLNSDSEDTPTLFQTQDIDKDKTVGDSSENSSQNNLKNDDGCVNNLFSSQLPLSSFNLPDSNIKTLENTQETSNNFQESKKNQKKTDLPNTQLSSSCLKLGDDNNSCFEFKKPEDITFKKSHLNKVLDHYFNDSSDSGSEDIFDLPETQPNFPKKCYENSQDLFDLPATQPFILHEIAPRTGCNAKLENEINDHSSSSGDENGLDFPQTQPFTVDDDLLSSDKSEHFEIDNLLNGNSNQTEASKYLIEKELDSVKKESSEFKQPGDKTSKVQKEKLLMNTSCESEKKDKNNESLIKKDTRKKTAGLTKYDESSLLNVGDKMKISVIPLTSTITNISSDIQSKVGEEIDSLKSQDISHDQMADDIPITQYNDELESQDIHEEVNDDLPPTQHDNELVLQDNTDDKMIDNLPPTQLNSLVTKHVIDDEMVDDHSLTQNDEPIVKSSGQSDHLYSKNLPEAQKTKNNTDSLLRNMISQSTSLSKSNSNVEFNVNKICEENDSVFAKIPKAKSKDSESSCVLSPSKEKNESLNKKALDNSSTQIKRTQEKNEQHVLYLPPQQLAICEDDQSSENFCNLPQTQPMLSYSDTFHSSDNNGDSRINKNKIVQSSKNFPLSSGIDHSKIEKKCDTVSKTSKQNDPDLKFSKEGKQPQEHKMHDFKEIVDLPNTQQGTISLGKNEGNSENSLKSFKTKTDKKKTDSQLVNKAVHQTKNLGEPNFVIPEISNSKASHSLPKPCNSQMNCTVLDDLLDLPETQLLEVPKISCSSETRDVSIAKESFKIPEIPLMKGNNRRVKDHSGDNKSYSDSQEIYFDLPETQPSELTCNSSSSCGKRSGVSKEDFKIPQTPRTEKNSFSLKSFESIKSPVDYADQDELFSLPETQPLELVLPPTSSDSESDGNTSYHNSEKDTDYIDSNLESSFDDLPPTQPAENTCADVKNKNNEDIENLKELIFEAKKAKEIKESTKIVGIHRNLPQVIMSKPIKPIPAPKSLCRKTFSFEQLEDSKVSIPHAGTTQLNNIAANQVKKPNDFLLTKHAQLGSSVKQTNKLESSDLDVKSNKSKLDQEKTSGIPIPNSSSYLSSKSTKNSSSCNEKKDVQKEKKERKKSENIPKENVKSSNKSMTSNKLNGNGHDENISSSSHHSKTNKKQEKHINNSKRRDSSDSLSSSKSSEKSSGHKRDSKFSTDKKKHNKNEDSCDKFDNFKNNEKEKKSYSKQESCDSYNSDHDQNSYNKRIVSEKSNNSKKNKSNRRDYDHELPDYSINDRDQSLNSLKKHSSQQNKNKELNLEKLQKRDKSCDSSKNIAISGPDESIQSTKDDKNKKDRKSEHSKHMNAETSQEYFTDSEELNCKKKDKNPEKSYYDKKQDGKTNTKSKDGNEKTKENRMPKSTRGDSREECSKKASKGQDDKSNENNKSSKESSLQMKRLESTKKHSKQKVSDEEDISSNLHYSKTNKKQEKYIDNTKKRRNSSDSISSAKSSEKSRGHKEESKFSGDKKKHSKNDNSSDKFNNHENCESESNKHKSKSKEKSINKFESKYDLNDAHKKDIDSFSDHGSASSKSKNRNRAKIKEDAKSYKIKPTIENKESNKRKSRKVSSESDSDSNHEQETDLMKRKSDKYCEADKPNTSKSLKCVKKEKSEFSDSDRKRYVKKEKFDFPYSNLEKTIKKEIFDSSDTSLSYPSIFEGSMGGMLSPSQIKQEPFDDYETDLDLLSKNYKRGEKRNFSDIIAKESSDEYPFNQEFMKAKKAHSSLASSKVQSCHRNDKDTVSSSKRKRSASGDTSDSKRQKRKPSESELSQKDIDAKTKLLQQKYPKKDKDRPSCSQSKKPKRNVLDVLNKAADDIIKNSTYKVTHESLSINGRIEFEVVKDSPISPEPKERKVIKKEDFKEEIAEEVKKVLKPFYSVGVIDKDDYKDIMRRAVPKIFVNCNHVIHPEKIKKLILNYVTKLKNS